MVLDQDSEFQQIKEKPALIEDLPDPASIGRVFQRYLISRGPL
jgi:predicted ATP-grasp superfamily ATP-dependent carboligase